MTEHPADDVEVPETPGVSVDGPDIVPMPTGAVTEGGGINAVTTGPKSYDAWNYRDEVGNDHRDLAGYRVDANDGHIGKVHRSSHDLNDGYLVVDTGPWIFGKKIVVPAGSVNHIDHAEGVVYLDRSKDQIKAGPDVDSEYFDQTGHDHVSDYYGRTYLPPSIR
jgi:hypothetical protein